MQVFRNIVVMPTQDLLHGMGNAERSLGGVFRGGPVFPFFPLQLRARQCRGPLPIPRDRRPVPAEPVRTLEAGVWCGPVCPHFGHMIADFGMRIAEAAHRTDLPLVFSLGPEADAKPKRFFRAILKHLGVSDERVLLVREPTRFRRLLVPAQAERPGGPGPSRAHLDLMDAIAARAGLVQQDIDLLYVSRARFTDGRLVAEPFLDAVLAKAGATVIHPEIIDFAAQIAMYRRAKRIVFAEGSAVHGLQMLGRLDCDVAVLVRRPGTCLARSALAARVRSLTFWDVTTHPIYGKKRNGKPQHNRALVLFDPAALMARFRAIGVDLAPHWDARAHADCVDADLRRWIAFMRERNRHPDTPATIRKCLAAAGLDIAIDKA